MNATDAEVLEYVREHPGCSAAALRSALGRDPRRALDNLLGRRKIGRQATFMRDLQHRYYAEEVDAKL